MNVFRIVNRCLISEIKSLCFCVNFDKFESANISVSGELILHQV